MVLSYQVEWVRKGENGCTQDKQEEANVCEYSENDVNQWTNVINEGQEVKDLEEHEQNAADDELPQVDHATLEVRELKLLLN